MGLLMISAHKSCTTSVDKTFTITNSGDVTGDSIVGDGLADPFTYKGGAYPGTGGSCSDSLETDGNLHSRCYL